MHTTSGHTFSILLFASLSMGCATRYLPPPRQPARVAPRVENEPVALREGEGRVTLDTPDGPASAELITQRTQIAGAQGGTYVGHHGHAAFVPSTQYTLRPLCQTPCAVNLPVGAHQILFTSVDPSSGRSSAAYVNVGATPSIARHAMGRQSTSVGALVGGILMAGLGAALSLVGGVVLALPDSASPRTAGSDIAGWTTLGIGLGLGVGGIVLGLAGRPTDQPGSTTQWVPSP
ncbi:MAG: hypothetical protein EPO40_01870 [Myxococcaceae bacterium]|nr:MAG: hypothetical protein EPO40_01870 [Myxococcaceae bacterium]